MVKRSGIGVLGGARNATVTSSAKKPKRELSGPCPRCGCPENLNQYGSFLFQGSCHCKPTNFDPCPLCGCTGTNNANPVKRDCDSEPEEIETIVSDVLAHVATITQHIKEQSKTMINLNEESKGRRGSQSSIPALKLENLSQDKRTCKVLETRQVTGTYGKQVAVKVTVGGGTYIWYLKMNNPNLRWLCDNFGTDETQWAGEEFMIGLEHDSFNNNLQIRCSAKEAKSKK